MRCNPTSILLGFSSFKLIFYQAKFASKHLKKYMNAPRLLVRNGALIDTDALGIGNVGDLAI